MSNDDSRASLTSEQLSDLLSLREHREPGPLLEAALAALMEVAGASRGTLELSDESGMGASRGKTKPPHPHSVELFGRDGAIAVLRYAAAGEPDGTVMRVACDLVSVVLEVLLLHVAGGANADDAQAEQASDLTREELKYEYEEIIGTSPSMIEVLAILDKVVESQIPVIIQGESGTGKELVARAIHMYGERKSKPFVSENCAALTETLLESELFGYVKGAFTGASGNKKGLFEVADGGTLFLDEVGDMSLGMQKKLLRALQEGEIRPVGSKSIRRVDVRVVSATNRNLKEMMSQGTFREDLFYRLNVVNLRLPSLRERKSDIPRLLEHFVEKVCLKYKMPPKTLSPETIAALTAYDWPGNIREMENEVNRMLFMGDDPVTPDVLSDAITRDL